MRVLHVITDLGEGGAEAVSFRLIGATSQRFEHSVVSMHQEGMYGARLRASGVSVTALGMKRGRVDFRSIRRLRDIVAGERPDVIQTRLYHADLCGGWAARNAGKPPVVWGVHSTELGALSATWKTRLVRRLCAWTSSTFPSSIVTDARTTANLHRSLGYDAAKLMIIRNGVDPIVFQPNPRDRESVRSRWGVAPGEILLGCVARWDPLKDHENLMRALSQLATGYGLFRCALVGAGMTTENRDLQRLVADSGLTDRMILAGTTGDVPATMNALDLHVLSSRSESLPVAVMEAMACGTPCVVTDAGDAGDIVADTGWVVPTRDSAALAKALHAAVVASRGSGWSARREACRSRVVREFSLARMADEYAAVWIRAHEARLRSRERRSTREPN
jgi:glycosyltransferase involved in cell wall biosynthesis